MSCYNQVIRELFTELSDFSLCNPRQSLKFVKQLIVIAISHITYLHDIFPENAYKICHLSGIPLKVLQEDNDLPLVRKMMTFIRSALEALTMKYLHKMIFVIEDLEGESMEVFTLNFLYNDSIDCYIRNENDETVTFSHTNDTPEEIKNQIQDWLRKLCMMIIPKQLSKTLSVNFRLVLNKDVPEDFHLKYFYHCDEIPCIDFPGGSCKIKLGKITTLFHGLTTNYHTCDKPIAIEMEDGAVMKSPN